MPLFEYQCKQCGAITEFLESASTQKEKEHKCRECGSPETEKIFSSFSARSGRLSSESGGCATGNCSLS